jgi:hypothetical protein
MEFKSIFDFIRTVPDEASCIQYLEEIRWAGNVISPFDETSKVYKCANNKYKCKNTGLYFNVRTGTIFESSKIELTKWFMALYIFSSRKKGISSYQLAKDISITQKSAWFLLHRLRYMFNHPSFKELLSGEVEVDETYIGGKSQNKHKSKRINMNAKGENNPKTPVVALLQRDGNVMAGTVRITDSETLKGIIYKNVGLGSSIITDSARQYHGLQGSFQHSIVNHNMDEYVVGKKHTNSVEGFFSHLKRTLIGTYHFASKKHLQAYVTEVVMRFNTRKISTNSRFDFSLTNMENRLTYKMLIA